MKLHKISVKDKDLFAKFLGKERHELSVYNFANIYIWRKFFEIEWSLINDALCVYFTDKIGSFLYLSPLGNRDEATLKEAFSILTRSNKNNNFSRIENAEESHISGYKKMGFGCRSKSCDYICDRLELACLSGNKFKSKRASLNYFLRHNRFTVSQYCAEDKEECLALYRLWMSQRDNPDGVYQNMLSDAKVALTESLDNFPKLGLQGVVVRVNGKIKGLTLGYELDKDIFCILFEVTDLSIKGLAQFIFKTFCVRLEKYKFINIMDDSGLGNLKKVKLSYKPARIIKAYSVFKDGS
jgi:hypothetical protein